jgi:hypothetical protein
MKNDELNVIVYSVNIGGYDYFNSPKTYDKNVRYILFTDNKFFKSDVWEVCHIDFIDNQLDNRKKSRYIKVNPHILLPKHDISIWIDHCFTPKFNNIIELLNNLSFTENDNIMIYKHSWRNCIYEESDEVLKQKLDDVEIVQNQISRYQKEGFPKNLGLFETGFIVRRNNKNISSFNTVWWDEIKNGSGRDQLSCVYAGWKSNVIIKQCNYGNSVYDNPFLSKKNSHIIKLRF